MVMILDSSPTRMLCNVSLTRWQCCLAVSGMSELPRWITELDGISAANNAAIEATLPPASYHEAVARHRGSSG